jgi:FdhD protein
MKKVDILRIEKDRRKPMQDMVAHEVSLRIAVDRQEPLMLPCSGTHVNEMITGYLFTNGYIDAVGDIRSLDYDMQHQTATVSTDPDKMMLDGFKWDRQLSLSVQRIFDTMREFSGLSHRFQQTGGVHSAAEANENGIRKYFDDISRHNAIDKIIGWNMLNNEPVEDKALLLTCRVSRSIIEKAVKAGFPMIISNSPPTDRAITIARDNGIALAGFVREDRMNIYHGEDSFKNND